MKKTKVNVIESKKIIKKSLKIRDRRNKIDKIIKAVEKFWSVVD